MGSAAGPGQHVTLPPCLWVTVAGHAARAGPAPCLGSVLTVANPFSVQQDAVDPLWDWDKPQLPGRPLLLQPAVQPGHLLAQRERLLQPGQQDSRVR